MSYQVLARKWRPRLFSQLVGQEHVVRALTNALDRDRLHHAYLFTGTRGVGKTTLARIFAKSLNCLAGVSSEPCGECAVCREIDEGRFTDLLEVDAASRTKVEQTRELLENVPYAPVQGRFKVYLIDEVHMFSSGSFNALLKTLEEPPPHVKFLLATTDPRKVPVTVLSRCLQFNLKRMPVDQISGHLRYVLGEEAMAFDPPALQLLARAADGSMRDALSLLDQAIAFGAGSVLEADVRRMLGTIDRERVNQLIEALAAADGALLMQRVDELAEQAPDFAGVLQEMLVLLHRIALYLEIPQTLERGLGDEDWVRRLAESISPEDAQLWYQIALIGRRDLPLAPDPRSGFEMVLLRMLAFRPVSHGAQDRSAPTGGRVASGSADSGTRVSTTRRSDPTAVHPTAATAGPHSMVTPATAPTTASAAVVSLRPVASSERAQETRIAQAQPDTPGDLPGGAEEWRKLVAALRLGGISRQLADHCVFDGIEGGMLTLTLESGHANLNTESSRSRLEQALQARLGAQIRLRLRIGDPSESSPAQLLAAEQSRQQQEIEQEMLRDPLVQALQRDFDAQVVAGSIRAVGSAPRKESR